MKAIWKFPIPILDDIELLMPKGARILSFQNQNEIPCIWVYVDETNEEKKEKRKFKIIGTGHPFSDSNIDPMIFIGTIQMMKGALVWHLFEVIPDPKVTQNE